MRLWSLGRGRSPGGRNGNPLQYSCLENSMDRGAWRATVCVMHPRLLRLCLTLCDVTDYSPPGSSIRGIFQARILEWVAILSFRGSSQLRDWTASPVSPALQVDSSLLSHREAGLQSTGLQRGGHAWAHTHTPFYKWRNWGSELGVWLGERHSFLYKLTHTFHFLLNNHCIK